MTCWQHTKVCRAAALATENPTPDLLTKKPHGRDEPLISKHMWRFIFSQGVYQVGVPVALMAVVDPGPVAGSKAFRVVSSSRDST